uniref:Uncharacterized protein n=2 Tax=Sus scrofa TaxID=9823 RepID=A0A8W4FKM3_PIG
QSEPVPVLVTRAVGQITRWEFIYLSNKHLLQGVFYILPSESFGCIAMKESALHCPACSAGSLSSPTISKSTSSAAFSNFYSFVAILMCSMPRMDGTERKDFSKQMRKVFKGQVAASDKYAKKSVKVINTAFYRVFHYHCLTASKEAVYPSPRRTSAA